MGDGIKALAMPITHNFLQIASQLRNARRRVSTRSAKTIRQTAALQILSWAKLDYSDRSEGGADAAGNKWKPLDPETPRRKRGGTAIGIDKGLQLASMDSAVEGNAAVARANQQYSEHFDKKRPIIFPNIITKDRKQELVDLIDITIENEIRKEKDID